MSDDTVVGLSVLVVEDFADSAEAMAAVLKAYGHQVRIASSGAAALVEVAVAEADVVLIDIGLPGIDGWELAGQLKQLAKPPVLIAITGLDREEDIRKSEQAGIHLHLVKPVNPATLVGLLKRVARMVHLTPLPGHPGT